jgi:hypothetical protein
VGVNTCVYKDRYYRTLNIEGNYGPGIQMNCTDDSESTIWIKGDTYSTTGWTRYTINDFKQLDK